MEFTFDLPEDAGRLEIKRSKDNVLNAFLSVNNPKKNGEIKRTSFTIAPRTTPTLDNMRAAIDCLKLDNSSKNKIIPLVTSALVEYFTSREEEEGDRQEEEVADWERNADEYKNPNVAAGRIRFVLNLPVKMMPSREARGEATKIVYKHLLSNGRFFFYPIQRLCFWFDSTSKLLFELNDDKFRSFASDRLGVNPEDKAFKWFLSGAEVRIAEHAEHAEPRRFTYFDEARSVLYVNNKPGRMLKIDGGDQIQEVDNGTDNIVFLWQDEWSPFEYTSEPQDNLRRDLIFSKFSLSEEETNLTLDELSVLLDSYIQCLFFRTIVLHRPILAAVGPFGSGKSISLLLIGIALFGPKFPVLGLEGQKEDGAIAYITNNVFGVFDNADERISWLPDMLARIATGMSIPRRKLYRTNTLVNYWVDLILGITARSTPWARPDVVSRLLLLRFKQPLRNMNENVLRLAVLNSRSELLSEFIWNANLRIRRLKLNASKSFPSHSRLAGFYEFGMKTSGSQELFNRAFLKVVGAQEVLSQEQEEALVTVLQKWLDAQRALPSLQESKERWTDKKVTSVLLTSLLKVAKESELDLGIAGKNPAQQLGQHLKQNRAMLASVGIIFKTEHTRSGTSYEFRLNSGSKSEDSSQDSGNREGDVGGDSGEKNPQENPSQMSQESPQKESTASQACRKDRTAPDDYEDQGITPNQDRNGKQSDDKTAAGGDLGNDSEIKSSVLQNKVLGAGEPAVTAVTNVTTYEDKVSVIAKEDVASEGARSSPPSDLSKVENGHWVRIRDSWVIQCDACHQFHGDKQEALDEHREKCPGIYCPKCNTNYGAPSLLAEHNRVLHAKREMS